MELTGPTIEVRERRGGVAGNAVAPVARRVRRRDEFEAVSLLLAVLVVLFVLAVTMGATPLFLTIPAAIAQPDRVAMPHDDRLSGHTKRASSAFAGPCERTLVPWAMTDLHDAMASWPHTRITPSWISNPPARSGGRNELT
jgi:hypothetical protein